jgi:hypothetical protein
VLTTLDLLHFLAELARGLQFSEVIANRKLRNSATRADSIPRHRAALVRSNPG